VKGDGIFNNCDLEGIYVNVNTKRLGTVTVWATNELDISILGEGKVQYYGDVTLNINNALGM